MPVEGKPHFRMTADGLVNLVSGMGTARDKAGQASYEMPVMDAGKLVAAYKASSLVRRVVDLPAEDAGREWREWQAEAADITKVEAEERRLGVQGKVIEARRLARLFGGSAILIGNGDLRTDMPLNPRAVKQGGLRYLTVLNSNDLSAGAIQRDPTQADYGKPIYWSVSANGTPLRVHPSRLALFHGVQPLNALGYDANLGWGDSALLGMLEAVTRVDEVAGNILSLVYEAKVDVIKIPELMQNLQQRGTAYSNELIRRLTLAATGKGINGTLIIDALEEYEQKSASFGGLHEVLDRFMQLASAASGIPMTLLFGMSPGGLNATGKSDEDNYFNRVRVEQTMHMQPAMSVLDECLIRSALGDRPEDLFYHWRPLGVPSVKERAETGKLLMESLTALNALQVLPPEVIGKTAVNGLTESGSHPGLEGYANDYFAENPDADEEMAAEREASAAAKVAMAQKPKVDPAISDAAPRTLYVRRDVLNAAEIIAWAKGQGFNTTLAADDMHVTVAFSRTMIDWMKVGQAWESKVEVPEGGPRLMERFGEARVLLFRASDLEWRHEAIKGAGASWDHPEYQPHITISYDPEAPDLASVTPYQGKIVLGPEIFEEVKEDWKARIAEE